MKETEQIFYVVKYWETKGILKYSGEILESGSVWNQLQILTRDKEAFLDESEARARVKTLKSKKIAALKKQISKIKAIDPATMPVK